MEDEKLENLKKMAQFSTGVHKAVISLLLDKGIFTKKELRLKTEELTGLTEKEVFANEAEPTGNASADISAAYDSLTNARFKLEAEKGGLNGDLAIKACSAIDAIINSLKKMSLDLKHAGF